MDVATSLEARNGIDRSIGLLLWLRHHLDSEAASRDLKRVFVRYERLITEPHATIDAMSDGLGLVWPRRSTHSNIEIDDFLTPALHHHRTDDATVGVNPRLSRWVRDSFGILDRWARGGPEKAGRKKLDRIRAAFDDATPTFGRPVAMALRKARELEESKHELEESKQ